MTDIILEHNLWARGYGLKPETILATADPLVTPGWDTLFVALYEARAGMLRYFDDRARVAELGRELVA